MVNMPASTTSIVYSKPRKDPMDSAWGGYSYKWKFKQVLDSGGSLPSLPKLHPPGESPLVRPSTPPPAMQE